MVNKGVKRQFLAATAGSLSILNVGIMLGWPSPIMQELLGPDSPIPMTVEQSSWFVSTSNWAVMVGSIPFGVMADRWGRRTTLQVIGPMTLAAWIALLFVDTVPGLMAVRFVQGLLTAGAYTVVPVYTGEIAGPEIRGALGTMFQIMMHVGVVFVYAAGTWLDYGRLTYAVIAVVAVVMGALFTGVPETPHYYAMRNRPADAKRSIEWLRGGGGKATADDDGVTDEMLAECNAAAAAASKSDGGGRKPAASLAQLFADPVSLRSLIVVQALAVFRITTGPMVIVSYASITFAEMHVRGGVRPNALSLAFGVLMLVAMVGCAALADRAGRRPLMIASSVLCSAFNAAVGGYLYVDRHTTYDVSAYGWLCAAALGCLSVAYCIGHGSLFSTISCELFPSDTRAAANAVSTVTLTILQLVCLKLYPVIADGGHMYRVYATFSAFSFVAALFCWQWLPETKGKTFAAIQAQLKR